MLHLHCEPVEPCGCACWLWACLRELGCVLPGPHQWGLARLVGNGWSLAAWICCNLQGAQTMWNNVMSMIACACQAAAEHFAHVQ